MTEGRADALLDQRYSGHPDPGQVWTRRRPGADRMFASWDIPAPDGTPVRAALDGEVIYSGVRAGYGETLILLHREPPQTEAAGSGALTTAYCHLRERRVHHGDEVEGGQVIGEVGATCEGPDGSRGSVRWLETHLHFSVQRVEGDTSRTRYEDEDGAFEGSGQVADPTTEALAGETQAWFTQAYEEDWTRQVKPDDWAAELGIDDAREDLGGRARPTYPRRRGGAAGEALLELEVVDEDDQALEGIRCRITLPNGRLQEVSSDAAGLVRVEGVPEGDCELELVDRRLNLWEVIAADEAEEGGEADSADGEGDEPQTTRSVPTGRRVRVRVLRNGVVRFWIFLGASPSRNATRDRSGIDAWIDARTTAIGATDLVLSLNSHGWATRAGLGAGGTLSERRAERTRRYDARLRATPPVWEPHLRWTDDGVVSRRLYEFLEVLHERGIGAHIMTFPAPVESFLVPMADTFKEIARNATAPIRSFILDPEWWWTDASGADFRDASAQVIKRELFDNWPDDLTRPELGIGLTGISLAVGALRSLLSVVDYGLPQMYYQGHFEDSPISTTDAIYRAYQDALGHTPAGEPKLVVAGQTAYVNLIGNHGRNLRTMLDAALRAGDPDDADHPPPREIAYWSDIHFSRNAGARGYMTRVKPLLAAGLTVTNLPPA